MDKMMLMMMGGSSRGATAFQGTGCVKVDIGADDSLGAVGVAAEETRGDAVAAALISRSCDGRLGMSGAEYYFAAAYTQSGR